MIEYEIRREVRDGIVNLSKREVLKFLGLTFSEVALKSKAIQMCTDTRLEGKENELEHKENMEIYLNMIELAKKLNENETTSI